MWMKEDRLPPVCDAVRLSDFLSPVMPNLWGRADGIGVGYGWRKDERNAKHMAISHCPLLLSDRSLFLGMMSRRPLSHRSKRYYTLPLSPSTKSTKQHLDVPNPYVSDSSNKAARMMECAACDGTCFNIFYAPFSVLHRLL